MILNNVTKMNISKQAHDIFEAFVDPIKIGNFWFSSSSERWETGKTITLKYDEYNAQVVIEVVEMEVDRKIVFVGGEDHRVTITLQPLNDESTVVEVMEEGFSEEDENIIAKMLDNKEGWVYMLTCLKGYLEHGVDLRASLVK